MKTTRTRRELWQTLAALALAATLAGCGQTGPLQLPQDRDAAGDTAAADEPDDEREDRDTAADER